MTAIFYTAELSLPEEDFQPFVDWFVGRHCVDLYRSGFYTVACYKTTEGDQQVLDIYQADSWDAFTTEGYAARGKDPYAKTKLANGFGFANTVYGYVEGTSGDPKKIIDSDWLTVFRFNGEDEAVEKLVKEIEGHEIWKSYGSKPLSFRVTTRKGVKNHPTLVSTRENNCLVIEWDHEPAPLAPIHTVVAELLGLSEDQVARTTGHRLYPWINNI